MENRNKALCLGCGILIYFGKDRKNNPPKLCPQCLLNNASALDLNPLKIVNQFYVQNKKPESDFMILTDRDEIESGNLDQIESDPEIEIESETEPESKPEPEKLHKRKLRRNSI